MSKLVLIGLDGSNLLGFLAALGVLRTTEGSRLGWTRQGSWIPVLEGDFPEDEAEFCNQLADRLKNLEWFPPIDSHDDSNKISPATLRQAASDSVEWSNGGRRRDWPDWVAALGCDSVLTDGLVSDTAFRTMSGAGHQHFLKTFRELQPVTNSRQLQHALFEPWSYTDGKPGLRFDASEDRRYALRWNEPSTDPVKTVRGANRLAVEAIPLFPTAPVGSRLETTGFRGSSSKDTWFAWPIWSSFLNVEVVRSLLSHPSLHRPERRGELTAMGITEVFQSRRLTLGKMRNFSPSLPLGDVSVP